MRGKILWSKNQEKNLVDYSQEMIYHYNTEGRHIAKKKKRTIKYLMQKLLKVTLFLNQNNYLSSTSHPNYKSILNNPEQNTIFISFCTNTVKRKKKNQVISWISLPTTVLLVPLGCGNREDPDEVAPGELDFLSAGGLY